MQEAFLTFINEQGLFAASDSILLTVSGGVDSVVMVELFYRAGFRFGIAHCNFQLRGEASAEDERLVVDLAERLGIKCWVQPFDAKAFAKTHHISTQMAARQLRYAWFEELRQQESFRYIATAHHQNDVLETVLLNLVKGTGIAGLHGIRPKNGFIIRPLLFAEKTQLKTFAIENQLLWREDSSNESSDYQRNLLRNEVIPLLKYINPNLEVTMQQTVEKLAAVEKVFDEEIARNRVELWREEAGVGYINFRKLQLLPAPLIRLFRLLEPYHFSYTQCKQIVQSLDSESGIFFYSSTHTLVKDRNELVIVRGMEQGVGSKERGVEEFVIEEFGKGEDGKHRLVIGSKKIVIEALEITWLSDVLSPTIQSTIALFDAERLSFPLTVRPWKAGDWFCPLGMKGRKKKVSDLLIDLKIPRNLKDDVWILTSQDQIAWVMGYRMDERFKVREDTQRLLKVEIEPL